MENQDLKNHITEFFHNMGFQIQSFKTTYDDVLETEIITLEINDQDQFLEVYGRPLQAVNQLVRRQLEQRVDRKDILNFIIDIGGVYMRKIDNLKNKAKIIAERSKSFKRDIQLDPMTGFERLVVHSVLAKFPYVRTESRGFGRNRKVTVYYVEKNDVTTDF